MAFSGVTTSEIKDKAIAHDDRESIEKLIRDYYDGIHRLARHLTRSQEDAADLAQATFIKACTKIDRFDGRSTYRAWLAGILYHEFLHWRRTRRFFSNLFDTHSFDPTEEIISREALLQAIHSLPAKLRDTFLLVEVHGFSLAEASITLNVPVGTIKSRLDASRTKLRALLKQEEINEI